MYCIPEDGANLENEGGEGGGRAIEKKSPRLSMKVMKGSFPK